MILRCGDLPETNNILGKENDKQGKKENSHLVEMIETLRVFGSITLMNFGCFVLGIVTN